jgi:hypothetical protein
MSSTRQRRQIDALVLLLDTLSAGVLEGVLERLEVKGAVALEHKDGERPDRRCATCGHYYPKCRQLAEATDDDHAFEVRA